MNQIPVQSSFIESIGYDYGMRRLEIHLHNRTILVYENFPGYLWQEFLAAPSKGRFYNAYIKEKF